MLRYTRTIELYIDEEKYLEWLEDNNIEAPTDLLNDVTDSFENWSDYELKNFIDSRNESIVDVLCDAYTERLI